MVDGLARATRDGFAALAAERMLDNDHGQAGDAEGAELAHRKPPERGRPDQAGRGARLRQLDGVVETPRRARPSVSRAGEDDVAVLGQARQDLRRGRRRGIGFATPNDGLDAVLGA